MTHDLASLIVLHNRQGRRLFTADGTGRLVLRSSESEAGRLFTADGTGRLVLRSSESEAGRLFTADGRAAMSS